MSIALRHYQADCVDALRACYAAGHRAPLLVLPTGGGKTVVFCAIAESAIRKGRRVLIVVHRRELLRQAVGKLGEAGVSCGIIAAGVACDPAEQVVVGSIQTIVRRLDQLPSFDLLIFDEAHHCVAEQWKKLINHQPKAKLLGVTATPARLDGKGLGIVAGGIFDALVQGPETGDLVDLGFLSPARVFVPEKRVNLSGVRVRAGDYAASDLEDAVAAAGLTGDAVQQYQRRADHQPAIAFCVSVHHAENVANAFRAAGYRAAMVSGSKPKAQRDADIAGLATGEVEVLTTCDLISEGLDVASVGAVILLRPTKSIVLHRQQVGRGLRPAPGKEALIVLDHAGNSLTLGLPDAPIEWSLAGTKKREAEAIAASPWQCDQCGCLNPPRHRMCAECGFEREIETPERPIIGQGTGDLAELTPEVLLAQQPYRQFVSEPRSEAELRAYAKAKNYKPGWVFYQMKSQRGQGVRR
jgi:DNA repair protein RadD